MRPREEADKGQKRTINLTSREQSSFFFAVIFVKCNYDPIIQIPTSGILQATSLPVLFGNGVLGRHTFFPIHGQGAKRSGEGQRGESTAVC